MNDIKWHTREDDDFYDLLSKFNNHPIIIITDVALRFSASKYFDSCSDKMIDYNERLEKFAFIKV